MSANRRANRRVLSRKEVETQRKVVARWSKMREAYLAMGLEELKRIENEKRSNTDDFAYKTALVELMKEN